MKVYPIWLNDLRGRRCIVFGTGHEAVRKVKELLACDADVVVVSPDPPGEIIPHERVEWIPRAYASGDLAGAFLAIVAETDPARTKPIHEEAQRRNVLINAMDDIPHCTFVAGSVVRRGQFALSISTSGAAPALSVRLRERFEQEFGPHYETFLDWMGALRAPMTIHYPDFGTRRKIWYAIVDSDVLSLLERGLESDAVQRLRTIAGTDVVQSAGINRDDSVCLDRFRQK